MNDTIAAIATPPGSGGIGIIRISGPETEQILTRVFQPAEARKQPFESHRMMYGRMMDGAETVDECMAVLMRAPRSYTREDVAELQLHGGYWNLRKGLEACLREGARLADAGEFTKRAFLNGRIDLSQAEAVMRLIAARGEQEHRAAVHQMEGDASAWIRKIADEIYSLQAALAVSMDYPEEVSEEESIEDILPGLETLIGEIRSGIDERGAEIIREGLRVTFYGRPNVGKSSLLNCLLGEERAIVTPIPGTTRDTVQGEIQLDGIRILLTDTAGIRSAEDPVEQMGVQRSEQAVRKADIPILVLDSSVSLDREDLEMAGKLPDNGILLLNKCDLTAAAQVDQILSSRPGTVCFHVSAFDGKTLNPLKDYLRGQVRVSDRIAVTQPRHLVLFRTALRHLSDARETLMRGAPDLAATDLQAAQDALAEMTGDRTDERLLDTIFSTFCVGK